MPDSADPCLQAIHPEARRGIQLFDAKEYFEAHEALETAWKDETGPIRDLYRGILQVAVAYYHLLKGNYVGARKMFQRCRPWLAPFPGHCLGIDLAQFTCDYEAVEQTLLRLGPRGLGEFDPTLLKPLPRVQVEEGSGW
jgi:hypothetical protein